MPCDYHNYPKDWKAIRAAILSRANHRCEACRAANHQPHPTTGSAVVLTVAHLDHDIQNNDPANLAALCQRCHLQLDRHQHGRNAARTHYARQHAHQRAAGQLHFEQSTSQPCSPVSIREPSREATK
jgi:5-methylcytosine-specific restriction endonuclease McrA